MSAKNKKSNISLSHGCHFRLLEATAVAFLIVRNLCSFSLSAKPPAAGFSAVL